MIFRHTGPVQLFQGRRFTNRRKEPQLQSDDVVQRETTLKQYCLTGDRKESAPQHAKMNGSAGSLQRALSRANTYHNTSRLRSSCLNDLHRAGAKRGPFDRETCGGLQARWGHAGNDRTKPPSDRSSSSKIESPKFPDPRDPKQHPLADLSIEEVLQDVKTLARNKAQQIPPVYHRKLTENGEAFAIGRRKCSEAKVWLREGTGEITVNDQPWIDYFPRVDHRDKILRPLDLLGVVGRFDVNCRVYGGGVNGQTDAVRHGIARALQNWDPHMRPTLKQDGLLTRDSRVVEPKKYGRKKARKSFTWVKR